MSLAAKNDCFIEPFLFQDDPHSMNDIALIQHPCADLADPGEPVAIRGHCDDIASGVLWLNGLGLFPKPHGGNISFLELSSGTLDI